MWEINWVHKHTRAEACINMLPAFRNLNRWTNHVVKKKHRLHFIRVVCSKPSWSVVGWLHSLNVVWSFLSFNDNFASSFFCSRLSWLDSSGAAPSGRDGAAVPWLWSVAEAIATQNTRMRARAGGSDTPLLLTGQVGIPIAQVWGKDLPPVASGR